MKAAVVATLLTLIFGISLHAQDRSSMAIELQAGTRSAIIEATCSSGGGQFMAGGAFRYHLSDHVSIGPEFMYVTSCRRQAFTFYHPRASALLQVVKDFGEGTVRPYVIGSVGASSHKSLYADAPMRAEFAGGGGAKFFFSDRFYVNPEAQVGGSVAFARFTVGVGFVLR